MSESAQSEYLEWESSMLGWLSEVIGDWFAVLPFVLVGVVIVTIITMIGMGIAALWRRITGSGDTER